MMMFSFSSGDNNLSSTRPSPCSVRHVPHPNMGKHLSASGSTYPAAARQPKEVADACANNSRSRDGRRGDAERLADGQRLPTCGVSDNSPAHIEARACQDTRSTGECKEGTEGRAALSVRHEVGLCHLELLDRRDFEGHAEHDGSRGEGDEGAPCITSRVKSDKGSMHARDGGGGDFVNGRIGHKLDEQPEEDVPTGVEGGSIDGKGNFVVDLLRKGDGGRVVHIAD